MFLKEFFEKVNFEKKSSDDNKKLPSMQRESPLENVNVFQVLSKLLNTCDYL